MPSHDSWIDLGEVARLVRRILPDPAPSGNPADARPEPSAGPLVGSADFPWMFGPDATFPDLDDLPLTADPDQESAASLPDGELRHRATRALRALQAVAAPPPSASSPAVRDTPGVPARSDLFRIPDAPLRSRLRSFADWTTSVTGCVSLRIVDAQGYSLLEQGEENDPQAVAAALQLLDALERVRGNVSGDGTRTGLYLPMQNDEWFGALECETSAGRICLSLVTRAPLARAAATELVETLRRTVDGR